MTPSNTPSYKCLHCGGVEITVKRVYGPNTKKVPERVIFECNDCGFMAEFSRNSSWWK